MTKVYNSNSAKALERHMAQMMKEIEKANERQMSEIVVQVWAELTEENPVDTGRSRASWIATDKVPSTYVPPEGDATYSPRQPSIKFDLKYPSWIVSNVSYMIKLNEGWSNKADAGWIEASIARGIQKVVKRG